MSEVMEYVDTFTQNKHTKKLERVACYVRVSTQEQKLHGISLDAQRDKLKEYAKKHGLKIVEWYEDEGVSGRKLIKNRPALQRMIKDAQEGKFDRIIFIKLDRFFRSVAEYHECMKKIDPVLWTATEEKYDLTTANGRAFVNMKITIAELEADQTSERIKIVNEYKIKNGQALQGDKSQGLAFTVKKDKNGVKRVVPDTETTHMVLDIIDHFITHKTKGFTLEYYNKKYQQEMSYKSLTQLLTNTKLYGFYKGNPNYCEPIITKETFDTIQAILKSNIKYTPTRRVYLFSGLIKCPSCGYVMTGKFSQSKLTNRDYYTYRCNHHFKDKSCDMKKQINETKLEPQLLDDFERLAREYMANINEVANDMPDSNTEIINKRIKEVKTEMSNSVKSFNKGRMSEAEHDREYAELEAELHELEAQLEPVVERDLTIYEEVLKSNWREIYDKLSRENKRAFWNKYIKTLELSVDGYFYKVTPIFF